MATARVSTDLPKLSFAKVASAIAAEKSTPSSTSRPAKQSKNQSKMVVSPNSVHVQYQPQTIPSSQPTNPSTTGAPSAADKTAASLADLRLGSNIPSLIVGGSNSSAAARSQAVFSRASGSDDSQKADSSSELGTKPPSLDGKSITSGTTFALDEKESLRPDDSASVKAAAEDDDSLSIRGSLFAGSRMGSDLAARARGIQLGDMPTRVLAQPTVGTHGHGILTPQSASSEQPTGPSQMPLRSAGGSSDALNVIYRQAPDEKLLEALSAPRDRLFLLRLEKDVIDFVQDSKEPYMDLPPSNSFCRMLTHKLADYYHMTHSYEPHIGSVRIFRTPFCRVPPSLATMIPQPTTSTSSTPPPPAVLPRKIMRRGQDEDGVLSAGPSKPTSEDGSDSKDKQSLANLKLSREEREEMYKQARQRIFGKSEESPSENEGEYGMSRTSSVSANKSSTSRKGKATTKQRRDDSDSFDSRRQYTAYWGPQQQTWVPQPQSQFVPPSTGQFAAPPPPPPPPSAAYPGQMPPVYNGQPPGYPAMPAMVSNPAYPPYPMPQYPSQPAQQRYPSNGSPMAAYGSPVLPPAAPPPQGWQQGFAPAPYQNRGPAPSGPTGHPGIPYAFGQLPVNIHPNDPKSQHPIPGSYNRNHAFNPKTQSFVPGGNNMPPVQPLQPPFTAPGSHHGSPQIGTPHLAYSGYPTTMPHSYGGGYGMARQGSNTSLAAYHAPPPHATPPHVQHPPPMQNLPHIPSNQHLPPSQPAHVPSRPNIPQGPNQLFGGHLPTYGNPATLPQKPTTGI